MFLGIGYDLQLSFNEVGRRDKKRVLVEDAASVWQHAITAKPPVVDKPPSLTQRVLAEPSLGAPFERKQPIAAYIAEAWVCWWSSSTISGNVEASGAAVCAVPLEGWVVNGLESDDPSEFFTVASLGVMVSNR